MEPWLRLREAPGVDLATGGEEDQEIDQLRVGVRDRWTLDKRAVDEFEHDVVVARDDDVFHVVVVDEGLESAEPEQRVEDRPGERILLGQ